MTIIIMMEAVWHQPKDYPNYLVSNLGIVMNSKTNKIIKPATDRYGYLKLNIYGEKRKTFLVHRLVAMSFLEDFSTDLQVDHIDRNKQNNNISNLRMATSSQNAFNKNKYKNTSSKYKGVCLNKTRNKWQSAARINGKSKTIGYYDIEEDARNAYVDFMNKNNLINQFTIL